MQSVGGVLVLIVSHLLQAAPSCLGCEGRILAPVQDGSDLGLFVIWRAALCWAAVLEPCWNTRAVVEVQRDVTSLCDVSKSTGQELHIKVGWIINKAVRGFSAAAEKQERWTPALTAQL